MRRSGLATIALVAVIGQPCLDAVAQDAPPPRDGVITPKTNVDPGMRVTPPKTPTATPIIHPPATDRNGKRPVIVPK